MTPVIIGGLIAFLIFMLTAVYACYGSLCKGTSNKTAVRAAPQDESRQASSGTKDNHIVPASAVQ